jgi:DNA-binding winged helix-turn-helix (wHTH) protein
VRLRFGPFTIDPDTRQLARDGSELHLSTKAFDLLWLLVEQRPRVVDKTTLQARIWPDTYVVDANLNVLIGEIRRALADSVKEPRFIRTVHGVGYAFCGAAEEAATPSSAARSTPCWVIAKDRTFRLSEGENIVGRDPASAVWLDFESVSRRHARIVVDAVDRRVSLDDLASKNGTRVRGVRVRAPIDLSDGDEIEFGEIRVKLRSWRLGTDEETKRIRKRTKN